MRGKIRQDRQIRIPLGIYMHKINYIQCYKHAYILTRRDTRYVVALVSVGVSVPLVELESLSMVVVVRARNGGGLFATVPKKTGMRKLR